MSLADVEIGTFVHILATEIKNSRGGGCDGHQGVEAWFFFFLFLQFPPTIYRQRDQVVMFESVPDAV